MKGRKEYSMGEKEFNLLEEPWICVIDHECRSTELSLMEVLLHAHEYEDLSGELPTQDVAVLRLLLAVLHTVFSRVDLDGDTAPLEEADDAYERWKDLWDAKQFPAKPIQDYFEIWKERFWLFHPERPFGQMAGLDYGTEYEAYKLNGELSQSGNKIRLFSSYAGDRKNYLEYEEAARWLLYLNAYDDTSAKPSKEGKKIAKKAGREMESPGVGWLGKLGLIHVKGNNLFETLMRNLILVQVHRDNEIPAYEKPIWERDVFPRNERVKINVPDNLAELYTLQSRRLFLIKEDSKVIGFRLLGGDFFEKEESVIEPMTLWRTKETKTSEIYIPKRHDFSKQIWREFSSVFIQSDNKGGIGLREPGVISWNRKLMEKHYIPSRMILETKMNSVQYGDKDFFVVHIYSDELLVHQTLLEEKGEKWQTYIIAQIEYCDNLADLIGNMARHLYLASGGDDKSTIDVRNKTREQFYFRLDIPFRKWLISIVPNDIKNENNKLAEWREEAKKIALSYADELIFQAGEKALVGRIIKKDDKRVHYSAAEAKNRLLIEIKKLYSDEEVIKDG